MIINQLWIKTVFVRDYRVWSIFCFILSSLNISYWKRKKHSTRCSL